MPPDRYASSDDLWEDRYERFSRHPLRWVLGIGLGITTIVVAFLIIAWAANLWFFAPQSVNREYRINQASQGFQAGMVQDLRNVANDYQKANLAVATQTDPSVKQGFVAQRIALHDHFCNEFVDLNPPPADLVAAHNQICNP